MATAMEILPEVNGDELDFIAGTIQGMTDEQAKRFASAYRARRKDPQMILLTPFLGLVGINGVQRFMLGQVGMGVLYLLTGGLCLIGTILDIINHKKLAFEFNRQQAQEIVAQMGA